MSPVLIGVALLLAVALWGFFSGPGGVTLGSGTGKSGNGMNAQQIADYAVNAGFGGSNLVIAIAVALAESGGNPQAVGDGGTSYGLWQIHWTVHPEFDKAQLFDPLYNANAAFAIFSSKGNFSDWSTYNSGTYQQFVPAAQDAATGATNV